MPQNPSYNLEPLDLGNETIGSRIARLRKERGLTQEELASLIGITQTSVASYESGRVRLYDEMVSRFAIALNVSADLVLGLDKAQQESKAPSLRVTRRVREIEALPENKKKAILKTIDDLIRANS